MCHKKLPQKTADMTGEGFFFATKGTEKLRFCFSAIVTKEEQDYERNYQDAFRDFDCERYFADRSLDFKCREDKQDRGETEA
jgi:hypothetical protein